MHSLQLQLGFSDPTRPATIHLALTGLTVMVDVRSGTTGEVWNYLESAGLDPDENLAGDMTFPVARLMGLARLPEQVTVLSEAQLRPLVNLVLFPSHEAPADLMLEVDGSLWLSWFDGVQAWSEPFPPQSAAALMLSEIPFVATQPALDVLYRECPLPLLLGRCTYNRDGFVEISSPRPQLLEGSHLPGLFRLDETHFGLPLPYLEHTERSTGFVWEGAWPRLEAAPSSLPPMPMPLSAHAREGLSDLVAGLAAYRSQAVLWESGLGRRILALAAVEALDAWPLLVVAPPSSLWVWGRHANLFSRTFSVLDGSGRAMSADADLVLVTYEEFARGAAVGDPQTMIFDDMTGAEARAPQVVAALVSLGSMTDAYRIGLARSWPKDPAELNDSMAMLRPGEFQGGADLLQRYPGNSVERFEQHVQCYLQTRSVGDPGQGSIAFPRSSVVTVEMTPALREALEKQRRHQPTGAVRVAEELEMISAGSSFVTSPKIAAAAAMAGEVAEAGRRVAVVTRHRRTEALLLGMLRAHTRGERPLVSVVRYERHLGDLRAFDEVIVVDLPFSYALLDAAVGPAGAPQGPSRVACLHMRDSMDDQLAVLAARRAAISTVTDGSLPPTKAEMDFLLSGL